MKTRTLIILCVLGVVCLAGGWYFGPAQTPTEHETVARGTLMFPDLTAKLANVARVEITHQGSTITLARKGDKTELPWGLLQRGLYPVEATKLRGMLTALTELRLVEPRTSDPNLYSRLGLEDADDKKSTSTLLKVFDAKDQVIAQVLVGHRRVHTAGNVPDEVFVRRPGDAQTWLAEGSLQVDADPQLWLDRDIMNIDHARIAGVVVHRDGTELDFKQQGDKLALTAPANPPKLEDYKLDELDRGLELLNFEDVVADKDATAPTVGDAIGTAAFTTTDGMVVNVTVLKGQKDIWARFTVTGSDKSKDEAAKLAARLSGWTYQLGAWKEASLVPNLDALKATAPAAPVGAPPAMSPTAPSASPPATSPPAAPSTVPPAAKP